MLADNHLDSPASDAAFIGPPKPIYVRSEADAIALLERALNEDQDLENTALLFEGWPIIEAHYEGGRFHASINSDIAEAILETQKAVNKAYVSLVLNKASAQHLTEANRETLKFNVRIEDGSSLVKVELGDATESLAQGMVNNMNGVETAIVVLGVALIWGGVSLAKHYFSEKSKEKSIDLATSMSQEETKRLQIMADAITQQPRLIPVQQDHEATTDAYIQAGETAERMTFNQVPITQEQAKELSKKERVYAQPEELNGNYLIYGLSFKSESSTNVSVRNAQTGAEFTATFKDEGLDQPQIEKLQKAAFAKRPVYLSINAKTSPRRVHKAKIISVDEQPDN